MDKKLYGQHLAIAAVVKHLKGHVKDNPPKALALSFHGSTGTGKNYVSKMIADSIYKKGMNSKFVKLISATKEFTHGEDSELLRSYKDKLKDIIESGVKECQQSLFIFDEMDKMPQGLIDIIKPYLEYYDHLDGKNYRKARFIFLSNTAGTDISEATLSHWTDGGNREDIKLKDMEQVIMKPALNANISGLWHSELITKHLITAYIPFLPLERKHAKQCIRDGLVSKGYYKSKDKIPDAKVSDIAKELTYYPDSNVYSTTGCKRVLEKIDFVMEEF